MHSRLGFVSVLLTLLTAPLLQAGEAMPAGEGSTVLDMLTLGLKFSPQITIIFGILLFVGLFLVFHILLSTREALTTPKPLFRMILDDVSAGDMDMAQKRASESQSLLARVVLPGLKLHAHPHGRVQQAMEGAGRRSIGSLRQEATYLANIGVIAPMLGLLGTVLGLMGAFAVIGNENIKEGSRAMAMSPAIAQAMTTTAVGLLVGIPAMGLYYLCMSRISRVADDVEIAAEEISVALHEAKAQAAKEEA